MAKPTKRPIKRKIEPVNDKVTRKTAPRQAVKKLPKAADAEVEAADEEATPKAGTKARAGSKDKSAAKDGDDKAASKRTSKRVTEKGGGPTASTRYTPPSARYEDMPSPLWVPIIMFTLFGLGMLTIFLNYVALLPGATSNWYLLLGLGFILGGIITATQYR